MFLLPIYVRDIIKEYISKQITGPDPPKPVSCFAHLGFDEQLMKAIRKSEYTQPTPIQAAGIPAALSGRDLIGELSLTVYF